MHGTVDIRPFGRLATPSGRLFTAAFVLLAVALASPGSIAWAGDTVVNSIASLQSAIYAAQPGDRILMAPGTYSGSVWIDRTGGGTTANPIVIAAQNPANPPVFQASGTSSGINIFDMSNYVLDGLVLNVNSVNGIQIAFGQNVVLKNIRSLTESTANGNSAYKFTGCSDFLFFNCTANQWGTCGVDMVGCKNGLLVNNTLSDTGVAGADDAFQTKGGSYNIGIYNNTLTNCGNRVIQIGGNTGADYFHQGNIGWEAYDNVAMGNTIVGGALRSTSAQPPTAASNTTPWSPLPADCCAS